jgi:hypothetical protein
VRRNQLICLRMHWSPPGAGRTFLGPQRLSPLAKQQSLQGDRDRRGTGAVENIYVQAPALCGSCPSNCECDILDDVALSGTLPRLRSARYTAIPIGLGGFVSSNGLSAAARITRSSQCLRR